MSLGAHRRLYTKGGDDMITISTVAAALVLFCVAIAGVVAGGVFALLTHKGQKSNESQPAK